MSGTDIVRFHEALIFVPRKNVKTTFAAALAYALALWYRKSGAKTYITSAALMQSLESFNFLVYNVRQMGAVSYTHLGSTRRGRKDYIYKAVAFKA